MKLFSKKNLSSLISHLSFQKGFTLIELLIVIAILGILAAAVLVAINPGQRIASARNARVRADLANVGNNANIYNADTGLEATCASGGSYPVVWGNNACGKTFMNAPVDPTGNSFGIEILPANCDGDIAGQACTAISIEAPAYSDGVINASVNNRWCWRSATCTITQTTAAGCAP